MNANEKAYREKLKLFFSQDEIDVHSIEELQEKLRRRQLLFPSASVGDFIKANTLINDVLKDKNIKTSLSKEEQKKIFKNAPKNINEEWERTTLVKSCKVPLIKKAALSSKEDVDKPVSKEKEIICKNHYKIKSMLTLLQFRKRGKEPVDFENNAICNEVINKKTELSEIESTLIKEYRKYRTRVSNRRTHKLRYVKRSELPKEKLEKIREEDRKRRKINFERDRLKINFQRRFHFYKLSDEEKEKVREYRRNHSKKYYIENREEIVKKREEWRKNNREIARESNKKYYRTMSEEARQRRKELRKKWCEENKEKIKEYNKIYRMKNRDKVKEAIKKYYKKNRKLKNEISLRHYHKHKEAINARKKEILLSKIIENKKEE